MAHLFWLGEHQLERIKPFFPKARGVAMEMSARC